MSPSRQERAKRVLSRPGGSGTAVVVFVYLLLGWVFPQPPEGETRSALSAAEASLMFVTGRALLGDGMGRVSGEWEDWIHGAGEPGAVAWGWP